MIWRCRPWFGSAWSGLARPGAAPHTRMKDDLTYLPAKYEDKARLAFEEIRYYCDNELYASFVDLICYSVFSFCTNSVEEACHIVEKFYAIHGI